MGVGSVDAQLGVGKVHFSEISLHNEVVSDVDEKLYRIAIDELQAHYINLEKNKLYLNRYSYQSLSNLFASLSEITKVHGYTSGSSDPYVSLPITDPGWETRADIATELIEDLRPVKGIRVAGLYTPPTVNFKREGENIILTTDSEETVFEPKTEGKQQLRLQDTEVVVLKETGEMKKVAGKEFPVETRSSKTVTVRPIVTVRNYGQLQVVD